MTGHGSLDGSEQSVLVRVVRGLDERNCGGQRWQPAIMETMVNLLQMFPIHLLE